MLSLQQTAVVSFVQNGSGSAFVEAVAGSGKTTTLLAALSSTVGDVVFCAFNKAIAEEIKAKVAKLNLGNRVQVGTFHSFGFQAWRAIYRYVKVDARLKTKRTNEFLGTPVEFQSFVSKLVSLAKQRVIQPSEIENDSLWYALVDHFDLANEIENQSEIANAISFAKRALAYHIRIGNEVIDFDDMIYLPVVKGCKMWENDFVFVDEAQDTNVARRMLVRKMLKADGRAIFVGDRNQSIYGFTGADSDAIDQIIRDFNCRTLPLTVTYRCPKAVVEVARQYVSHITAADTAPEGKTQTITWTPGEKSGLGEMIQGKQFDAINDAILCRKVAPMVKLAYTLLRAGVACHIEGRDIGAGLIRLVERFKAKSISALKTKLQDYCDREMENLKAKGRETQAEALEDSVATVIAIINSQPPATTVEELRSRIQSLFLDTDGETKKTLTLATIHKSKGREWNRVFVLGVNKYMPSKYARQAWQIQQETNLFYVAYTRAKQELVQIEVE